MPTTTQSIGWSTKRKAVVWLVVFSVIYWTFFHRDKPPRQEHLVAENHATLNEIVDHGNTYSPTTNSNKGLAVFKNVTEQPLLTVVGDGIAGVAAAINSPINDVRLFGSRSYWEELHGVPEVWQSTTSLDMVFKTAKFEEPSTIVNQKKGTPPTRLLWIAVERSRLLALRDLLNNPNFHYARSGRSRLSFEVNNWKVNDTFGNELSTKGPVILATGIAKPKTIVEILKPNSNHQQPYKTRHDLVVDKKIIGSDDYFAIPAPLDDLKTVGILGGGGAAWDAALHAIESGHAAKVVVFGPADPDHSTRSTGLYVNAAFKKLQEKHGAKICTVAGNINDVKYESGVGVDAPNIVVEMTAKNATVSYGDGTSSCFALEQKDKLQFDRIDKLVEALGRDEGGTAEILKALETALGGISYEICKKNKDNRWVGARVNFKGATSGNNNPPNNVYLVGAMAASALKLIPNSGVWTDLLTEFSADKDLQNEHPPHGFAGAAYTGSQLVQCFEKNGQWGNWCTCKQPTVNDLQARIIR